MVWQKYFSLSQSSHFKTTLFHTYRLSFASNKGLGGVDNIMASKMDSEHKAALDSVISRFFINLPSAEHHSFERIFIQLEQAFWFYDG